MNRKDSSIVVIVAVVAIALLAGCIPSPYPMKFMRYEFDKDTQKWTQEDCTTDSLTGIMQPELETVCYKETIPALPPGVETGKK